MEEDLCQVNDAAEHIGQKIVIEHMVILFFCLLKMCEAKGKKLCSFHLTLKIKCDIPVWFNPAENRPEDVF